MSDASDPTKILVLWAEVANRTAESQGFQVPG
jgi:hypothetical protein